MRLRLVYACAAILLASCNQQSRSSDAAVARNTPEGVSPFDAKAHAPEGYTLPDGVLDAVSLANWAKLKRDDRPADAFTKRFSDKHLAGRKFSVRINLSNEELGRPMDWSYNQDKEQLSLELDMTTIKGGGEMIPIQRTRETGPSKIMTNAFGTSVDVKTDETWMIGIGSSYKPVGIIPFDRSISGKGFTFYNALTTNIHLPGDAARQLVKGAAVLIEGSVVGDKEGNTVDCGITTSDATIDNPVEGTDHACIIQSKFTRIAFVDAKGKIIKEWRQ